MSGGLLNCLGLAGGGLTALVGGGGKTTLMYALAGEARARGLRTVAATTTKIYPPPPELGAVLQLTRDFSTLRKLDCSPTSPLPVLGAGLRADGKVAGIPPEWCDRLVGKGLAELLIVEADGSRGLPLKAPGPDEPVVPSGASHFVAVLGLSCLGRPLGEVAFRPELAASITGLSPEAPVTAEAAARLLTHPDGLSKGCPAGARGIIVLNQADTPELIEAGRAIALAAFGGPVSWERAVITRLWPGKSTCEPILPPTPHK